MKTLGIILNAIVVLACVYLCLILAQEYTKRPNVASEPQKVDSQERTYYHDSLYEPQLPQEGKVVKDEPIIDQSNNSIRETFPSVVRAEETTATCTNCGATRKTNGPPPYYCFSCNKEFNPPVLDIPKSEVQRYFQVRFSGPTTSLDPSGSENGDVWFNEGEQIVKIKLYGQIHSYAFKDVFTKIIGNPITLPNDIKNPKEGDVWKNSTEDVYKRYHRGRVETLHEIIP